MKFYIFKKKEIESKIAGCCAIKHRKFRLWGLIPTMRSTLKIFFLPKLQFFVRGKMSEKS